MTKSVKNGKQKKQTFYGRTKTTMGGLNYSKQRQTHKQLKDCKTRYNKKKAIIIAPDDTCGVDTLKRSKSSLQKLYDKGYHDGEKISEFLSNA